MVALVTDLTGLGLAPELAMRLGYTTYAGDPTNNVTPQFIGQEILDTSNNDWYIAHGLTSSTWQKFAG